MASSSSRIYLGLSVKLPPDQLFTLERHFLPLGKIGGFPAWLNPMALPSADELACSVNYYSFNILSHFFAELWNPNGLFAADLLHSSGRSAPCLPPGALLVCLPAGNMLKGLQNKIILNRYFIKINDASNFAVFRCQLPRQNAFYSATEALDPALVGDQPDPFHAETHAKLCAVCGCRAGKRCAKCARRHYCSREHQIIVCLFMGKPVNHFNF